MEALQPDCHQRPQQRRDQGREQPDQQTVLQRGDEKFSAETALGGELTTEQQRIPVGGEARPYRVTCLLYTSRCV